MCNIVETTKDSHWVIACWKCSKYFQLNLYETAIQTNSTFSETELLARIQIVLGGAPGSLTIYTYILPPKFKILQVFLEFRGLTFLKPLLVESILCIFHFQAANWSFSPRQRELKQPENHRKEWESPSKLNSARQWDPNLVLFRTIHKICGNWIILAKLFIIQNHHTNQHPTLARSFQSSIIQPICQDDPVVTDWFFDLHGLFTLGSAFYWYQLEF